MSDRRLSTSVGPGGLFQRWADVEARPRIVLSEDLELLWSNAAADEELAAGAHVAIEDGRLALVDQNEMAEFKRFLARSTETVSAWVSIQRNGAATVYRAWRIADGDLVAHGVVFHTSDSRYVPQWADFSRAFGLTGAEFKVARRLLDGLKIEAVAEELGITIGTARIHVRNLYGKLEVSSREALFRLLAAFRIA